MTDDISALMTKNKGKMVLLRLRSGRTVKGMLLDFDIHMNLTLDEAEDSSDSETIKVGKILLRGDNILAISLPDEPPE